MKLFNPYSPLYSGEVQLIATVKIMEIFQSYTDFNIFDIINFQELTYELIAALF